MCLLVMAMIIVRRMAHIDQIMSREHADDLIAHVADDHVAAAHRTEERLRS